MDFNDTPEEAKFRKEAYEWLKANAELKDGPKDGQRENAYSFIQRTNSTNKSKKVMLSPPVNEICSND